MDPFTIFVAVVSIISGVASYQQAKKMQRDADRESRGVEANIESNIKAIPVIYGERRVGGTRVYIDTSKDIGNKYLYMVMAMAEGEVEDIDVESIEIDGVPITDDKFIRSGLGANFTCEVFYGSDTQSASDLIIDGVAYSNAAEVPPEVAIYLSGQESDKPWNQNHKLNGVAYLAMRFLWDTNAYNGVPDVTAIVKGKKVYDPRNPTAPKAWSNNPALCIRDYLTSSRYGKGIPESAINDAMFSQAANDYDSFVVTPYDGGDDITLFELNTVIDTEVKIINNLNDMLMSCRGFLPYVDGKYGIRVDQATNHVIEVGSDHIIGGISIAGTKKEDRFNQVKVNFFNKDKEYKEDTAVFPDVDDPSDVNNLYQQYLTEDGGEPLVDDIKIDGISNYYTAREMAKLFLLRSRLGTAIAFRGTSELMELEVGDTFLITQPTPAWTNKKFQVQEIGLNFDGTVNIQAIEYSDSIYTYNEASEETPFVPTKLPDPNKLAPVTLPTASAGSFIDTDGRTVPFIDISWTAPNDALVERYEIKYTINDEAVTYSAIAIDTAHRIVEAKGSYDIEIYAVNGFGSKSTGVTLSDVIAVADTSAPANITGVSITSALQSISLKWTNPSDNDFDLVRIKVADTNAEPTAHSFEVRSDSFVHDIGAYSTTKHYWLAPVDRTGNVGSYVSGGSATTGSIAIGDVPAVAGTFYLTLGDNNAPSNAEFNTAVGRNPIKGDVVVLNKEYFFTRKVSAWEAVTEFIDGSLLVSDSVTASQIDVSGLITTGSLAVTGDLPTALSELTNDTNFIDGVSWTEISGTKPNVSVFGDAIVQSDVDSSIDNIVISGRNLISVISLDGAPTDGVYGGKKYARKLGRNNANYRIDNWDGLSNIRQSGKYSLSFWAKVNDSGDNPVTSDLNLQVDIGDQNSTAYTINSNWKYYTLENVQVDNYLGSPYFGFIDMNVNGNVMFYVSNVKLEYGTKTTDWTPAPEDVETPSWYSVTGAVNTNAPANSTYLAVANRNPVQGDVVLITDTSGSSKNYQYDGNAWQAITALIRGDLLVSDSVTANEINVTKLSSLSSDLGAITAGSININSGALTIDEDGNLVGTSVTVSGDITANKLKLTEAQVEDSRSSPSLILSSSQLDQSVINLIDTRIEGYGLASSGDFAEDTGGFNNTIPDHPVLEDFAHLNGKNVVIELTASSTWSGTGSPTYPPQYPNNDSSLVIEIQRRVSTETDWTNAVVVDTITNGTSLNTVITGGTWVYGYSSVWFNGLTINYTFNDDPATGTYDYRAFIKTIGTNYTGVSTFYFEANEAGTASGGGVNDYVDSFSINDSTGVITVGRTGALGDLTASISTYVGNRVSALVDSAPATLDTLNELAAALGDDKNFAQTTTTALGTKWTQDNTKISNWDDAHEQQHSWEWKYITYDNSIQVVDNTEAEMLAWYKNYFINISEATLSSYPVQYEGHINTYDVDTSGTFGGSLGSHWTAEETYHAHIYTNIYVEKPFTVTNSAFAGDDDHALFINGEFVSGSINTLQPSYTYSFKKGWYRIDLIFDEQAGGDYIQLGWNPKDYTSYISDMTPYRGGDNPIHLSDKINAVNNSSNWDTAYGWGNHASAGYLTSYTEADTLDSVTGRGATTTNDIEVNKTDAYLQVHYDNNSRGGIAALSGQRVATYTTTSGDDLVFGYSTSPVSSANFVQRMKIDNGTGNVTIAGTLSASGYNKSNWDTAYGWGNHATDSYLLSGDVKVTSGSIVYEGDAYMGFIPYPKGAQFRSDDASHDGYIKISLPDVVDSGDDMISFWVDIYDYTTNESISLFVGGYNYLTSSVGAYWYNCHALVLTKQASKDFNVRFGFDGTRKYIAIGEVDTIWSHPCAVVRDFQGSYRSNIDQYRDDWSISISTTALTGVDETISANLPVASSASKWTSPRVLTLTGDVSGTVTWDGSANASMLVAVGDDSHSHSNYITNNADDTTSGSISTAINKYFGYASTYRYTPYTTGGIGTRSELISAANFLIHADTDGSGANEFVSIRAGAGTANELKLLSKTSAAGVNNQALTLNGNKVFNDGYHPNADKWTTARTITLGGDLSGSVSIDGSANVTLSAQVVNDSHNHDGRYTPVESGSFTVGGDANTYYPVYFTGGSQQLLTEVEIYRAYSEAAPTEWSGSPTHRGGLNFKFRANWGGWGGALYDLVVEDFRESYSTMVADMGWFGNQRGFYVLLRGGGGLYHFRTSGGSAGTPTVATGNVDPYGNGSGINTRTSVNTSGYLYTRNYIRGGTLYDNGSRVFHETYHPNADKWTTARTLSLTGDVTGSVSWDGSSNASITTAVANDSHTHDGRYYTEAESDSRFANITGDTFTGNLVVNGGWLESHGFFYLRDDLNFINSEANGWHTIIEKNGGSPYFNAIDSYRIGGQTVIDDSRNLTNIGTISSNNRISTSSSVSASTLSGLTTGQGSFYAYHPENHPYGTITYYPTIASSSKHTNGYRQHLSIGHKRNSAWDDAYIAVGGSDSYPTKEWLFDGQFGSFSSTSYKVGGTTVIDSSRNLTNIDDASIGTGSSNFTRYVSGNLNVPDLQFYAGGKTGWGIGDELGKIRWHINDASGVGARDAVRIVPVCEFGNGTNTTTFSGGLAFHTSAYNEQPRETIRFGSDGNINVKVGGYQVNGTTVIDASRNITNVPTLLIGGERNTTGVVTGADHPLDVIGVQANSLSDTSSDFAYTGNATQTASLQAQHSANKHTLYGYQASTLSFKASNSSQVFDCGRIVGTVDPYNQSGYQGGLAFFVKSDANTSDLSYSSGRVSDTTTSKLLPALLLGTNGGGGADVRSTFQGDLHVRNGQLNVYQTEALPTAVFTSSGAGVYGATICVGETIPSNTLIDSNDRSLVTVSGAYPALNLNHTVTSNAHHGPTLQFTHNGYNSNRQWVVGSDGQGKRLDFGVSGGTAGTNSNNNPHHGISGLNGKTVMRLFENGIVVGGLGVYPNVPESTSYALEVFGDARTSGDLSAGSFKVSGTTVIDASRNLTDIGSINAVGDFEFNDSSFSHMPGHYYHNSYANGNIYIHLYNNKGAAVSNTYFRFKNGTNFTALWHDSSNQHLNYDNNFNINGSVLVNGTTVIDSSRNAFFSNTTHTGNMYWDGHIYWGASKNIYVQSGECSFDVSTSAQWRVWDATNSIDAIKVTGGSQVEIGEAGARGLKVFGATNSTTGYQVNGTTVIDASRNLTDIASISSTGNHSMNGDSYTLYGANSTWSAYLQVGGNSRQYVDNSTVASVVTSNGNLHIDASNGKDTYINFYDGNKVYFGNGNNGTCAVVDSAGNATFNGNITAYSDRRLKDNIKTLDGSKVYEMRGVSFTKDGELGSGVIAQELEQVAPELVLTNDDEMQTKSVAYGNVVGYLIEAIKELKLEIEELKNGNNTN